MKEKELVFRLNRAIGQVESIRKQIESEKEEDCLQVLQQLKASINALKKFGEAYITEEMDKCFSKGKSKKEMKSMLKSVISSSFSL